MFTDRISHANAGDDKDDPFLIMSSEGLVIAEGHSTMRMRIP